MEGYISQIIGPVVDVRFPETEGQLPAIDEALSIRREPPKFDELADITPAE